MFVEVAVNLPQVRGTFHYHLPRMLEGRVEPGQLVVVPFGRQRAQGIVISLPDEPAVPETRPVESVVDPAPVVTRAQLELARWLQAQTRSSLIDCLTLMLPPGLSRQADSLYTLVDRHPQLEGPTERRIVELVAALGPLRGRQLRRRLPRTAWRPAVERLVRRGVLQRAPVLEPPRVRPARVRTVSLRVDPHAARAALDDLGPAGRASTARRRRVLETLIDEAVPVEFSWLYAEHGANRRDLLVLQERGLIQLDEQEVWRDPLADLDYVPAEAPALTADQAAVWEEIRQTIAAGETPNAHAFLLHGVTGSGKTEIYLRVAQETLNRGRGVIVLIPEIALTPQTVQRFHARFPGSVGVLHSRLSEGERYDTWRRCRSGSLPLIVGPRSALFAPLPDIGLIVVDEAHDDSYKEASQSPRYHAREAALAYAQITQAVCVLGSATPDVVTTYRAERGALHRLSLPQRILGHRQRILQQSTRLGITPRYRPTESEADAIGMPPVLVVDMRQELRAGNRSLFSRALQRGLASTLEAGQQAILFLNRRGAATHVFCRDCGWVARCPRCHTSLTFHADVGRLICHHCHYTRNSPTTCPECGGRRVKYFGVGTQKVQNEAERLFSGVRTLRWDWDTTRTKSAHQVILAHFASHRADVLVGTQMIAKGLDLPLVTLVGVVSADTALHLPDYRAAERTFQILTQVAGRAGRGLLGGRVILQTYEPDHYAIRAASGHDYGAFYEQEIRHRRELGYPPFSRLAKLVFEGTSEAAAERAAGELARRLQRAIRSAGSAASLIGPVPCYFRRVRGLYRWQVILRARDPRPLIPEELPEGWSIDVDPVSLL